MEQVEEAAYALGSTGRGLGWPRNPALVPEVGQTVRGLENGSRIVQHVFHGYVRGWDASADAPTS